MLYYNELFYELDQIGYFIKMPFLRYIFLLMVIHVDGRLSLLSNKNLNPRFSLYYCAELDQRYFHNNDK